MACYDAADHGHFRPHRDNTTSGTAHRRFAVSLFLNSGEYEGGFLRFPEYGPALSSAPLGGAVVFSCSVLREATPVTRGLRYMFLPLLYDEPAREERAGAFIRSHLERHHLIVAEAEGEVVGFLAYRVDWFQCTFVTLVVVREDYRRKGIAREFFKSVEAVSPTPRLFSSTEETNAVSIQMHRALGFQPSGHIDNLPQGVRELLFYKRIPPRTLGSTS